MIKDKLTKTLNGLKQVWRKFGINLLFALIVWLSPSWLSLFVPALKPYAVKWLILVVSPAVPSYLAVPMLAVIIILLRKGVMWLYKWVKDQLIKLKLGAVLLTLADKEEAELVIEHFKVMKTIKDTRTLEFKTKLKNERLKLIRENWETELEE